MVCTNLELDRVNKQKQIEAKEHEHRQRELAIQELEQKARLWSSVAKFTIYTIC
jgi:hypothetical protein